MRIIDSCAKCMYDRQRERVQDKEYLAEVRKLLDERGETESSPVLVYRFNQAYKKRFGKSDGYAEVKKHYNDLMLSIEDELRARIENSDDPLKTALALARTGNYIDYGAMGHVDESTCLELVKGAKLREEEEGVYESFLQNCQKARNFLLAADNCGEIVLDKLFLEQLKKRYPALRLRVLVRGEEVLNDVTTADAVYCGIGQTAEIISNGLAIAGTVYDMLPERAREVFDESDLILAKGQGNYESMSGQGRHAFYTFLCKCELFTRRFQVPLFTGMLVEEMAAYREEKSGGSKTAGKERS